MSIAASKASDAALRRRGALLVAASGLVWSTGGLLARSVTTDGWTTVFWRSVFAVLFLVAWLVISQGWRGALAQVRAMGWPGVAVGCCFAGGSTCFVLALTHTSVANVLLLQPGVPLISALIVWSLYREPIGRSTALAIVAVFIGMGVMVSGSFTGKVSPVGDGLALLVAALFAIATVITRRNAHIAMTPAVCLGALIAAAFSGLMGGATLASAPDMAVLVAFGAFNLGLGLAFFAAGARLAPAPVAGLVGLSEPALGPLWVWLAYGEAPDLRALVGGGVILAALAAHFIAEGVSARRKDQRQ